MKRKAIEEIYILLAKSLRLFKESINGKIKQAGTMRSLPA
jgi:hypothetical protein